VTVSPSLPEAGPEMLTAKSALGLVLTTDPVTVTLLLAVLGSGFWALTVDVLLNAAPLAKLAGAETTRVKVSELPEAILAVAVSVAVPPDCDRVKASAPVVCVIDTKTEPAGRVSDRTTPWAALGPLLVMVIVYVAFVPAVTEDGPLAVTAMSVDGNGLLSVKLATAVPQLAVASVLANSLAAQKLPSDGSTLMPLRSPARPPLAKSL
jgi:hypothetical protein